MDRATEDTLNFQDDRPRITEGSGNVFADIGTPNPEEDQLKAQLVRRISAIIAQRGLSPTDAAGILGITQPTVSALIDGRLSGFSVDRLFRFLTGLGTDVEIVLKPASHERGEARVSVVSR